MVCQCFLLSEYHSHFTASFKSNVMCRILPVLSADAEKVAELKVFLSLESLMSKYNLCLYTFLFCMLTECVCCGTSIFLKTNATSMVLQSTNALLLSVLLMATVLLFIFN